MMDLLGSDLPVESEEGMQFAWSDGILLQVTNNLCCLCLVLITNFASMISLLLGHSGSEEWILGFA